MNIRLRPRMPLMTVLLVAVFATMAGEILAGAGESRPATAEAPAFQPGDRSFVRSEWRPRNER